MANHPFPAALSATRCARKNNEQPDCSAWFPRPRGSLGSLAAAFILLRSHTPLALGDYAEWTYHGVLLRNTLEGHPDPGYQLKHYPVPNSLTTVGLGLLMLVFSWKVASALWLAAQSAFGFFSAYSLGHASGKLQGWQLMTIASAALFGGAFWYGFMNFLWGTYFAMLLCALLLRDCRRLWLLALVLTLGFFSHMVPFAFAVLALALYAWQAREKRLLLAAVPGVLLSAWYFFGRFTHHNADGHAGMESVVPYMSSTFAAFKLNTFLKCFGFVNPALRPGDSILLAKTGTPAFLLLISLDVVIAAAAMVLFIREARHSLETRSPTRFCWIAVTIFSLVSLTMPAEAAGISDPGGRMMEVSVWCCLLLVAARTPWASSFLGAGSAVLLGVSLFLLITVASQPPIFGSETASVPLRVRQFGHIIYEARYANYIDIQQNRMDAAIYPTAMFLETRPKPAAAPAAR